MNLTYTNSYINLGDAIDAFQAFFKNTKNILIGQSINFVDGEYYLSIFYNIY